MKDTADINYQNIIKVLDKILANWGVQQEEALALMGLDKKEEQNLRSGEYQISEEAQRRMALLLNIHEQLTLVFSNPDNIKIFITTPNKAGVFGSSDPLELMLGKGLPGIEQTYMHLKSLRTS